MMSNAPVISSKRFKRALYRDFPNDLRPSKLSSFFAHVGGTVLEFSTPLILLFSHNRTLTLVAIIAMLVFHVVIISMFALAAPNEWNLLFAFTTATLFWNYPAEQGWGIEHMSNWWVPVAILAGLAFFPILGELRPDKVSFLPSLRQYAGNWASAQWASVWAAKLTTSIPGSTAREWTQIYSSLGACVGTIVAAMAGDWLGRRVTYVVMCALSLGATLLFYGGNSEYGSRFLATAFLLGATTASFYGWLPLYLPELFRTSVRATGQGFGFNFGRILAAIGALQSGALTSMLPEGTKLLGVKLAGGYPAACSTMSMVYLVGFFVIWLAPETRGKPLPE